VDGTTKVPRMFDLYQLLNMQGVEEKRIAQWRGQAKFIFGL
jgi:hypothetical protein